MLSQTKQFFKDNEADIILVVGIVLISLISFGGGWLMADSSKSNQDNEGIIIKEASLEELQAKLPQGEAIDQESREETKKYEEEEPKKIKILKPQNKDLINENTRNEEEIQEAEDEPLQEESQIVGNKSSKIYHFTSCPGAKMMNDENKTYFDSKEEAKKEGYRAAKNCPGLED